MARHPASLANIRDKPIGPSFPIAITSLRTGADIRFLMSAATDACASLLPTPFSDRRALASSKIAPTLRFHCPGEYLGSLFFQPARKK